MVSTTARMTHSKKIPSTDGEYLEMATEIQTAYNDSQRDFRKQLRQCHNVIADLSNAVKEQQTMIDAYAQTLLLLQKSGLLHRPTESVDQLPITSPRALTSKALVHYYQIIKKELEEDQWNQANFIGSIVDIAHWRGSKAIQYNDQHKNKDFAAEARAMFDVIALESGRLWRPAHIRNSDAPDPITYCQNLKVEIEDEE